MMVNKLEKTILFALGNEYTIKQENGLLLTLWYKRETLVAPPGYQTANSGIPGHISSSPNNSL